MFIVDSHCHLNMKGIKENLPIVLENAKNNNIKCLQSICTHLDEFEEIYNIALQHPQIVCSVGVHPCDVEKCKEFTVDELVDCTKREKVTALGETGLDYYWSSEYIDKQQECLIKHIEAARITSLPLIIHARGVDKDIVNILDKYVKMYNIKGVIHCFTGSQWMCNKMLDLGFYISISGIVTFKNSINLQDIAKNIPMDHLLIETDSPYLAPTPFRGKTNEPANVYEILKFLAGLRKKQVEDLAQITTKNFFSLFSKATKFFQDYRGNL